MNEGQNGDFGGLVSNSGNFGAQQGPSMGAPSGSWSNNPQSYGSGDIILGSEPKKSKKSLVFVLIGLFVVIVIIAVVLLGLNIKKGAADFTLDEYWERYLSLLVSGGEDAESLEGADSVSIESLEESESRNIYNIPRYDDPLSEENIVYYNKLQESLSGVDSKIDAADFGEDEKRYLRFYVGNSKSMLSFYFISSALVYTNASYDYFLENGNLDGLLSQYGYPIGETNGAMMEDFKAMIDEVYDSKVRFYGVISQTSCIGDNGIDYVCLNENGGDSYDDVQLQMTRAEANLGSYVNNMLEILIANMEGVNSVLEGGEA